MPNTTKLVNASKSFLFSSSKKDKAERLKAFLLAEKETLSPISEDDRMVSPSNRAAFYVAFFATVK
jgi:hypothetical protein